MPCLVCDIASSCVDTACAQPCLLFEKDVQLQRERPEGQGEVEYNAGLIAIRQVGIPHLLACR